MGKVELNRVVSGDYEAVTYAEHNQITCLVEKDGNLVTQTVLLRGSVYVNHPLGGGSLIFDAKKYLGGMTCSKPPKEFDLDKFTMIVAGSTPRSEEKGSTFHYVIGDEPSSGVTFVCSLYFNKVFQRVFLGDMNVEEALQEVNANQQ